jgi:hypothetical protein
MTPVQDTVVTLGLYVAGFVLFCALMVGGIYLAGPNKDGIYDPVGDLAYLFRTKPKVVSVTSRYIRGVFDDDVELLCTVKNSGAAGTVNLFAVLSSGNQRREKKETFRMNHEGVAEVRFLFSEFQRGQATFGVATNDDVIHDPRILKPVEE